MTVRSSGRSRPYVRASDTSPGGTPSAVDHASGLRTTQPEAWPQPLQNALAAEAVPTGVPHPGQNLAPA